jgi:acyl-CoA synthetase (AMP-forming)/AMP-acid ligase II
MALQSAERYGEGLAVVDGPLQLSFCDVRNQMLEVASSMVASGVSPGDRVALWAPNSATWITSALGVLASGAWLVPINTRFTSAEVGPILEKVAAKLVLVDDEFVGREKLESLDTAHPRRRDRYETVRLPGRGRPQGAEWNDFLGRGAEVGTDGVMARIDGLESDDVSDIIFTSGTTGTAKGVMLRHGASLRAYAAFNESFGVAEGDRVVIPLPFFHCFGYKAGWMLNLRSGATSYPVAVFDAGSVTALVQRYSVTHLPGTPTMFWGVLNEPTRAGRELPSVLGIARVLAGYGLTESHALISFSRPDDPPELVATSVGKVADGVEVRAVGPDGAALPAGSAGELLVRGYVRMTGYYQDDEATRTAITQDGWLRTGDIGSVDEYGYVRITDRKKDIFISGGFNVAPAEVENALSELQQVAHSAVVGVPDERMGEVGAVFVVPGAGIALTDAEVITFLRAKLASYKVPRYVHIVDRLPLNPTGKVIKDELRSMHANV